VVVHKLVGLVHGILAVALTLALVVASVGVAAASEGVEKLEHIVAAGIQGLPWEQYRSRVESSARPDQLLASPGSLLVSLYAFEGRATRLCHQ
jgi:hypothetical protein